MRIVRFVLALVLWSSAATAAEYPVLFIHGFCSSAETWDATLPQLPRTGMVRMRRASTSARCRPAPGRRSPPHEDVPDRFSDLHDGFDPLAVANHPHLQAMATEGRDRRDRFHRRAESHPRRTQPAVVPRAYIQASARSRDT